MVTSLATLNKRFKFDSKNCHASCGAKIKANFLHNLSGRYNSFED
jgi:hypothetical protein